jgi:rhomboid protease GluP
VSGPGRGAPRLPALTVTLGLTALTVLTFSAQVLSDWVFGFDLVAGLAAKVNRAIAAGQVWRLVTPLFVHGGIVHLLVNMYSLNVLGPLVERLFGGRRMLAVYLLAGVGGSVASLALTPAASIGASGAIFGLLGALAAFLALHRRDLGTAGRLQLRQLALVALLNLGLGLTPGIDNAAHLGGLLTGAALAAGAGPRLQLVQVDLEYARWQDTRPWQQVWPRLAAAAAALAALAWAVLRVTQG